MCRVMLVLIITVAFRSPAAAVAAQAATPEPALLLGVKTETSIDFPRGIEFTVNLSALASTTEALRVELHYTVGGDKTKHLVRVPDSARSAPAGLIINLSLDLQADFVPSGVTLEYHWRVLSESAESGRTRPETVSWFDTRWSWERVQSDQVVVHTHDLGPEFANEILDSAQSTITDLEHRYALEHSQPIAIWVYSSHDDFRGAQQLNSRDSIVGASYPGYFLIIVVLPEGDTREVGRVIPHEISHQVLYQATANPFTLPPLWFDEGMATHYQVGGTDGYLSMVIAAHEKDRLFELTSLETSFPFLPTQATLAYATSWSALEFIRQRFGDDGIERLIAAFATGESFDVAIRNALGVTMTQLNDQWRVWIESQTQVASSTGGVSIPARRLAA